MNDPRDMMAAYAEGTLSAEEVAELEAWLRQDPERAKAWVRDAMVGCHLDELLRQQNLEHVNADEANDASDELPPIHIDANALTKQQVVSALTYVLKHTFTPRRLITGGIAAAALLGTVIAIVLMSGPRHEQQVAEQSNEPERVELVTPAQLPIVATLTAQHYAQWAEGAFAPGTELSPGTRLTLTAGVAEITTHSGAVAIIEAPVTVELLDNNNALHLHTGKLVALCQTASSKGFTVQTRHADIVDLGTEFGVHVLNDEITATVFSGEIELAIPDDQPQRLVASQTAYLRVLGNSRQVVVDHQLAKGFDQLLRPAVVTNARINSDKFQARVVPRGVYEDVKVYTDRTHELNGSDADGIPPVLRGGDLVMMPANARRDITPDLKRIEIELDLAEPADIYVLFPDMIRPASWLVRDYERTEMVIGLDRAEGTQGETPGIGPGNSIDNQFVVWKRKGQAVGTVTAAYNIEQSMYSIIVVPATQIK